MTLVGTYLARNAIDCVQKSQQRDLMSSRPSIGNRLVRLSTKDSVKESEKKMRIHKRAADELNQRTDKGRQSKIEETEE